MPFPGAAISRTTLSVSISASASSTFTCSPGCLCHATSVPSCTDSGSSFTLTSIIDQNLLMHVRVCARQRKHYNSRLFFCCRGDGCARQAERAFHDLFLTFEVAMVIAPRRSRHARPARVDEPLVGPQRCLQ